MKVQCLQVGAIETNCYLLCDEAANVCAIIDPGDEAARIAAANRRRVRVMAQSFCLGVEERIATHRFRRGASRNGEFANRAR